MNRMTTTHDGGASSLAEEDLTPSREDLADIIENAPVGISQSTATRLIQVNTRFALMFGYERPADALASVFHLKDLFVDPEQGRDIIREASESKSCVYREVQCRRFDKASFTAKLSLRAIRGQSGELRFFQWFVEDVSEQKKAERAAASALGYNQMLLHRSPIGIITFRASGEVVSANPAAAQMVGAEPKELEVQNFRYLDSWKASGLAVLAETALQTSQSQKVVVHHRSTFNKDVWLSGEFVPFEYDGERQLLAMLVDVTESKKAEESLKVLERFARNALDSLVAHIAILDQSGTILEVNAAWRRFAAENPPRNTEVCEGANYLATCYAVVGEDKAAAHAFADGIRSVLEGRREEFSVEYPCDSPRERRWFLGRVSRFVGKGPWRAVVTHENITARKQTEEALHESENRLRFALESSHIGAWDLDLVSHSAFRSLEHDRMFGYKELLPQWTYETLLQHVLPSDRPGVEAKFAQAATSLGILDFECRIMRVDGETRWIWATGRRYKDQCGKALRMAGIVQDITERKQAQIKVQESQQRLKLASQAANLGIWDWDIEQNRMTWDEQMFRIHGIAEKPATYGIEILHGGIYPDDLARVMEASRSALGGEKDYDVEFRVRHPDGAIRHIQANGLVLRNNKGEPIRMLGVNRDISQRKWAEEALRESGAKLDAALASMTDAVVIVDCQGRFIEFNDAFATFHRFRNKKECPTHLAEYRDSTDLIMADGSLAHFDQRPIPRALRGDRNSNAEFGWRRKDTGEQWYGSCSYAPIRDKSGVIVGAVAVVRDITERKQLEQQFLQAQKMEAIGQLAGGVAHDFNNILGASMLQLGLLQLSSSLDQETKATLRDLVREAQRAANLIRQLLLFSRRSVMEVKTLDMNELVINLLKMLKRLIGEHITMHFEPKINLPSIEADPGMIEQVILNLCVNARDAMPKGGQMVISLESIEADEARIQAKPDAQPGLFVCLSVADTGCGMDEATMKHIFEPFFTTKEVGKGTGLGLATVHGIVGQHKGWVEVESKVGQGTTFRVFFPATAQKAIDLPAVEERELVRGKETILLVEDEVGLLRITARGLRLLGYGVYEATNGQEALTVWKEHGHQIDLLFTDMVMPEGITGLELADELCGLKPGLKVIIASGYSAEIVAQGLPPGKNLVRLQKPYKIQNLAKVVRESLDRR